MKKVIFMFLFCFSWCVFSSVAYAGTDNITEIEVTSGIDLEKDKISTFDVSRQISGSANYGTVVSIKVCTINFKGELQERESYEISVGKSGIFSQSIELRLGENLVEINAVEEGKDKFSDEITINRKKSVIKQKLENEMYLPGDGI